jgi:hypothetical protein
MFARVFERGRAQFFGAGYAQTPPPDLIFLQRKFAGTFMLCGRLRARVDVRGVFSGEIWAGVRGVLAWFDRRKSAGVRRVHFQTTRARVNAQHDAINHVPKIMKNNAVNACGTKRLQGVNRSILAAPGSVLFRVMLTDSTAPP